MAGEITISQSFIVNNTTTGYTYKFQPSAYTATQVGLFAEGGVQNIGTASEAIVVGDVATAGWFVAKNLHTSLSIELSPNASTSSVFGLLAAGETCMIPLGTTAINARVQHTSATNTANLQYYFHNR